MTSSEKLLWCYGLAFPVYSLGPGPRLGLWVTGCKRGCRGCQSYNLQDKKAGYPLTITQVCNRILSYNNNLQGISLSGGEPFEQINAVSILLKQISGFKILFTGRFKRASRATYL